MSSGGQVTIKPITRISLCQALLPHYLCERRAVLSREVRDELCVVPDHHLVARVAELLRDPPDLLAALKRERRKGVSGLVHRPVAKTRAPERGLRPPATERGATDHGAPALRRGPPSAGVLQAACEGRRLRGKPDRDSRRQGPQRSSHDATGSGQDLARATHRPGAGPTRGRSPSRGRLGRATRSPPAEVPAYRARMGVAVGLPRYTVLRGPSHRSASPPSSPRIRSPARREGRRPCRGHSQARHVPHPPTLLRNPPARG